MKSHSVLCDSLQPHGLYSPWNFPGQNTGVGSLSLLQEVFPTQGSNPDLPHFARILYQLSHKESPRILEREGSLSFLQQIFPTPESNQGLLNCRQILYQLNYEGNPDRGKPGHRLLWKISIFVLQHQQFAAVNSFDLKNNLKSKCFINNWLSLFVLQQTLRRFLGYVIMDLPNLLLFHFPTLSLLTSFFKGHVPGPCCGPL